MKISNKKKIFLKQNFIELKILYPENVSKNYVDWMNNKSIVKYTEQRYYKHTEQSVKKFVDKKFKSKNNFLFGIFFHKKHIGNIKLGPIIKIRKTSDISYIIGFKKYWNKGIASISVALVTTFAFKILKLKTLRAASYLDNLGSIYVLKKNGYVFSRYSKIRNRKIVFLIKKNNKL